jgi:putative tryptophan/tyrosine transport system substrate-binding protein
MRAKILAYALPAFILATIHLAEAQQPKKVPRIGILPPGPITERMHLWEAFRQSLREMGYVEGQNIFLVFPSGEVNPERLPHLAAELVRLKVDVIVAPSASVRAAMNATRTIPIVTPINSDLVRIVGSLARPGGNVTGLTALASDLSGKRLELLKEVVPEVSRIAVLSSPSNAVVRPQIRETEITARAFGVQLERLEVSGPDDFEMAFQAARKKRAGALIALDVAFFFTHRAQMVKLAVKSRLPAIYAFKEFVDAGGLMSYAANLVDLYRRAAVYVDKILKGRKPADLPVEQPTKFELVINLKAAKQIGLTIPPNVLVRADKVIK